MIISLSVKKCAKILLFCLLVFSKLQKSLASFHIRFAFYFLFPPPEESCRWILVYFLHFHLVYESQEKSKHFSRKLFDLRWHLFISTLAFSAFKIYLKFQFLTLRKRWQTWPVTKMTCAALLPKMFQFRRNVVSYICMHPMIDKRCCGTW